MKNFMMRLLAAKNYNTNLDDVALAILRVFIGLTMAFSHGLGKLPPNEMLIGGVSGMGFPAPELFAWLAALAEFAGGLLLAAGLLTRPAALTVIITMLVAVFGVHAADSFQQKEMALLYLFTALFFLLHGAGRWSLDHFITKKN
ncbi:DoxD-like family protein [Bdellovibrio bacteriovorus]|uniref:DoxD-like family protein n=1 Tax=Bdellovibrio bacteriovorus TaxID=959 RepID=A0A150WIJ5_BDEBC|nr:DoxX family protein [Bdellovibrio bacteriovorus]KYG63440.1 DoxD-like family protein [Bdellovibrio bacteriovorus]